MVKDNLDKKLTQRQELAVRELGKGNGLAAAARVVGVSRQTIYRWLSDPGFAAAMNRWRESVVTLAQGQILAGLGDAASTVVKAAREGNARIAMTLLEKTGVFDPIARHLTDPHAIARDQSLHARAEQAALDNVEQDLIDTEQLNTLRRVHRELRPSAQPTDAQSSTPPPTNAPSLNADTPDGGVPQVGRTRQTCASQDADQAQVSGVPATRGTQPRNVPSPNADTPDGGAPQVGRTRQTCASGNTDAAQVSGVPATRGAQADPIEPPHPPQETPRRLSDSHPLPAHTTPDSEASHPPFASATYVPDPELEAAIAAADALKAAETAILEQRQRAAEQSATPKPPPNPPAPAPLVPASEAIPVTPSHPSHSSDAAARLKKNRRAADACATVRAKVDRWDPYAPGMPEPIDKLEDQFTDIWREDRRR